MRAGLRLQSWIVCVSRGLQGGFEDYPGPLGERGGWWGCCWEDVGARSEGSLESRGVQEDLGLLHSSVADGGGCLYW